MGKKKTLLLDYSIVQDFLKGMGGDDALTLTGIVMKKNNVTDEQIGKKMKHLKITEIRALLNRLHFHGIAFYQKTRDSKSGWYSYTWNIKNSRIAELILEAQAERMEQLEQKLDFEKDHEFFSCKKGCDSLAFEIAAEYHFKCPICGGTMDLIDNNKRVRQIKNKIKRIKTEVTELEKMK